MRLTAPAMPSFRLAAMVVLTTSRGYQEIPSDVVVVILYLMLSYLTQCSNPAITVLAIAYMCTEQSIVDLLKQVQTTSHCAPHISPSSF